MNNNTHHIDNFYKSRFENFEPEVPDRVWSNIRKDLINKKKKKIVFFVRYGIAASVAVLFTIGTIFLFDNKNSNMPVAENHQQTQQITSVGPQSNLLAKQNEFIQENNDLNTELIVEENKSKAQNRQLFEKGLIADNDDNMSSNTDVKSIEKGNVTTYESNAIASIKSNEPNYKNDNGSVANAVQDFISKDMDIFKPDVNKIAVNDNISDNIANNAGKDIQHTDILRNNDLQPPVDSTSFNNNNAVDANNELKQIAANNNEIQLEENKLPGGDSIFSVKLTDQQLIAQNELAYTDVNNKTIWAVGGQFSPVYTLNQDFVYGSEYSKDAAPVYENTTYLNNASQPEPKAEMSYSGGLMVKMQKGGRFSIRTGVYYSNKKQTVSDIPLLNTVQENSSTFKAEIENVNVVFQGESNKMLNTHRDNTFNGYTTEMQNKLAGIANPDRGFDESEAEYAINSVENPMQLQINLEQEVEYIEVPLILEYKLIDQRMDLHVHGGINTGFLVVNSAQMEMGNNKLWQGKTEDMNKVIYSASFGFGLGYDVSKRVSFNFEPTLKYGLSDINKDKTVFDHPYSLGFFTGVSYNF